MSYYVLTEDANRQPQGPVTALQLIAAHQAGHINNETLVAAEGFAEWVPLITIAGRILEDAYAPLPPEAADAPNLVPASDAAASDVARDPSLSTARSWQADEWFDRIMKIELRTEKEVEIKFIVPLLTRLGYEEDDRYDGMPVSAAHGSKRTVLISDFALFNSSLESLRHQPLLTVESKREFRLKKRKELFSAHNQAKSYCLWTQCDFFLVTDSRTVQAFHLARGGLNHLSPLFSCERHELRDRFGDLYALISRDVLTRHYLAKPIHEGTISKS